LVCHNAKPYDINGNEVFVEAIGTQSFKELFYYPSSRIGQEYFYSLAFLLIKDVRCFFTRIK